LKSAPLAPVAVPITCTITLDIFCEELQKTKRKDSAGSDDTASMIKGGGYLGAPRQTMKKKLMWVSGSGGLCAVAPGPNP